MILDEVKVVQHDIQTIGVEGYVQKSWLPLTIKNSLIDLLNQKNIKQNLQETLTKNASQLASLGSNYLGNAGSRVLGFLSSFVKILAQIGIVFIVAIFISIEKT